MKRIDYDRFPQYARAEFRHLPGATTPEERAVCALLIAESYEDLGEIVELGPWMGSLTIPMARLLQERKLDGGHRIHSHDLFVWEAFMEDWSAGSLLAGRLPVGADYRPFFVENLGDLAPQVEAIAADLETATWQGGEIEFLLNDAVKSPAIAQNVIQQFVSRMIPGRSVILNQDYLWCTESYVQIMMYRLRDYFEFVHRTPNAAMVEFQRNEVPFPDPEELADFPTSWPEFEAAEIDAAFAWSATLFEDPVCVQMVELGKAMMLLYQDRIEEGRAIVAAIHGENFVADPFFEHMERTIIDWEFGRMLGIPELIDP